MLTLPLIIAALLLIASMAVADETPASPGIGDTPTTETPDVTAPAADVAPDAQPSDKGTETPTEGQPPAEVPEVTVEALQKSLRAVTAERNKLKAELKGSATAPTPEKPAEPTAPQTGTHQVDGEEYPDAGKLDAVLKGLAYDESDGTVYLDNQWVSKRVALAVMRDEARVTQEQQAQQARDEQEKTDALDGIIEGFKSSALETCKAAFKNVPDESMPAVHSIVLQEAVNHLRSKGIDFGDPFNLPENFPAIAKEALSLGIQNGRKIVLGLQSAQVTANLDAAEKAPVAGGGTAAMPAGKTWSDLNPEERENANKSLWDRIRSKHRQ